MGSKMKLSSALSASLASYAAGIKPSSRTICKPGTNCILNLQKMQLSNEQFVEVGQHRVKNMQEESDFCIGYGLSRFEISGQTSHQDILLYHKEKDQKHAGFYPICIADHSSQRDYKITWEITGEIGCYNFGCETADTFCCSAYHGQDKNADCSLGAQRAAIQPEDFYINHNGHFCVKHHMSPVYDPDVRVEEPIVDEPIVDESPIDELNDITWPGYACSGFSMCLPNPYTYQPEGNILCTVTYNDRTAALKDCLATDCSHLLEYEFKGSTHYELLTKSDLLEQNCPNSSPRLSEADIKPRAAYRTVRREKRSIDDPVKISTTYDIVGHSEIPFQQRKNFYPELNYTDIIVEAHNEYGENRFLIDHQSDLRVGVINDFCIISPETANDWRNYETKHEHNPAMPNTVSVSLKTSYKDSEHSLEMFPDVIQQACENKKLLDLEYIVQTDNETFELPVNGLVEYPEMSKRIRRAVTTRDGKKICPFRYCEESSSGECRQNDYKEPNSDNYAWKWHPSTPAITTVCNTQQGYGAECERHGETRRLPNCWYEQGVVRGQGAWGEMTMKSNIPVFVHLSSSDMFCMPCCSKNRIRDLTIDDIDMRQKSRSQREKQIREANENKNHMPVCEDITLRSSMCFWLLDHGRCGQDFPAAHNQYMFIRDDVVTPASIKTDKDECNARQPSPRNNDPDVIMYDYY